MKSEKNVYGLALGTLFAGMHFLWVLTVWSGMGQALADMWHAVHFLGDRHELLPASLGTGVMGVVTAFIVGYALGWVFASLLARFRK